MPFSKTNRDIRRAEARALVDALKEEERRDRRYSLRLFMFSAVLISSAGIGIIAIAAGVIG